MRRKRRKRRWFLLLMVAFCVIVWRKWSKKEWSPCISAPEEERGKIEEFLKRMREADTEKLQEALEKEFLHLSLSVKKGKFSRRLIIKASPRVAIAKIYEGGKIRLIDADGIIYKGKLDSALPLLKGTLTPSVIHLLKEMQSVGLSPYVNTVQTNGERVTLWTVNPRVHVMLGRPSREKLLYLLYLIRYLKDAQYACRYIDMRFEQVYVGGLKKRKRGDGDE